MRFSDEEHERLDSLTRMHDMPAEAVIRLLLRKEYHELLAALSRAPSFDFALRSG
jgi:hypothetical protein